MHEVSYFASWIYFVYFLLFYVLIQNSNNRGRQIKNGEIAFLYVYLFAIFRYGIGSDYMGYWNAVAGVSDERTYEFFSGIIMNFVTNVKFPPLLFFIFSTISLFSYRFVINKYSNNRVLSWYFYFTFPALFLQDCSTLRNSAAMACFFMAFAFAENGKMWKCLICIVCAPLFHDSGYISLLILFLPLLKKLNGKLDIIFKLNVIVFIASFFAGAIVERIISSYLGGLQLVDHFLYYVETEASGLKAFQYVFYLINILNLLLYKSLVKMNFTNYIYITLVNVGLCLYNIFSIEPITAIRLCCYFFLFQILIIPSYRDVFVKFLGSKLKSNVFFVVLMFSLQLAMVIRYLYSYNHGGMDTLDIAPYRLWLFHI